MLNLIPKIVYDNYKENKLCNTFESATLFMDISGFTPMTERLMNLGNLGIEVLSDVLNNVFDSVIKVIYKNNGFVSGFAGDALTAVFKDASPEQCLYTAYEIRELFKNEAGIQKTRLGEFQLYVKLGLSYGEIECGIVGNDDNKTYYFSGKAVDGCANSEHYCKRMNIVLDEAFLKNLSIQDIETNKISEGYYELVKLNINEESKETKTTKIIFKNDILSKFFPKKILELSISGELKDIASVFISFDEKKNKRIQ